jgi:outer membrane immunogenic protein
MQRVLVAGIAAAALYIAPALAAPPAPMFNWSGFYVGGNAGGAWSKVHVQMLSGSGTPIDAQAENNAETLGLRSNAFIGGGQGGYNWQAGFVVLGLETDFNSLHLRNSQGPATFRFGSPGTFSVTQSVNTNWLFTARPRLGIATNNLLIYGTGGVAVTDLHYNEAFTDNATGNASENARISKTKGGWTAGGGVEIALLGNWSAKAEYLHAEFGGVTTSAVNNVAEVNIHNVSTLRVDMVRAALNYRFGH